MLPFVLIILSSVIILSVWTAIDPLVWVRMPLTGFDDEGKKNPDEPLTTYGHCNSVNSGILPYVVPLLVLFAVVMGVTARFSWKLKGTSTDFNDSKLTFVAIFTHIETSLVGIPLLIITNSVSKDGYYLMGAVLAFVFPVSMISLVIWPKIYLYIRDTYLGGPPKSNQLGMLGVGKTTHIFGLDLNDPETKRTKELERKVNYLESALAQKSSELRSSLINNPMVLDQNVSNSSLGKESAQEKDENESLTIHAD